MLQMKCTLICAVLLSLVLQSCQEEQDPTGFVNIADEYDLYVTQVLGPEGGTGAIHVKSIEVAECANATLSHNLSASNSTVELLINDIIVEGHCVEAPHHVSATFDLDVSHSTKDIIINIKNAVVNKGKFVSNAEEFELELESKDGLKLNKTKINRIHKDLIWGGFSTADPQVRNDILKVLVEMDKGFSINQGDYGLFYIDQERNVVNDELSDLDVTFIMYSDTDLDELRSNLIMIPNGELSLVFNATNYKGNTINID